MCNPSSFFPPSKLLLLLLVQEDVSQTGLSWSIHYECLRQEGFMWHECTRSLPSWHLFRLAAPSRTHSDSSICLPQPLQQLLHWKKCLPLAYGLVDSQVVFKFYPRYLTFVCLFINISPLRRRRRRLLFSQSLSAKPTHTRQTNQSVGSNSQVDCCPRRHRRTGCGLAR